MPTDTGTSVDRLMEEKIPATRDEPSPPLQGESSGTVKVKESKKPTRVVVEEEKTR